jgi:hypothetical protein
MTPAKFLHIDSEYFDKQERDKKKFMRPSSLTSLKAMIDFQVPGLKNLIIVESVEMLVTLKQLNKDMTTKRNEFEVTINNLVLKDPVKLVSSGVLLSTQQLIAKSALDLKLQKDDLLVELFAQKEQTSAVKKRFEEIGEENHKLKKENEILIEELEKS